MKLKVCHFSSVHHVWDTRVFTRECSSLAVEFDVTLIAIGDGLYYKNGVKIIGIKKPKHILYRFLITIFHSFILAVKEDATIYHIHDAEMIPFGIVLRILGKRVIYDIHENTYTDILLKPWLPMPFRKLFAKLYNLLLWLGARFMHYIVVVADPKFVNEFFVSERDCTIIQNFADPMELQGFVVNNREELPGNHLFYVGMIRDMYYDIDPVLEAIFLLKKNGIFTKLHLIGYFGTHTQNQFDHLPFWNEIKDQVKYYGFLEMEAAYEISKQCKIGLCIKNQPAEMLVSHERKLFEYMAIGLPSIFCDTHIYQDLNERFEIGLAVDLKSPEQLADAISRLLTQKGFLNQLSKNNRTCSKEYFNWQHEEVKLKEVYRNLMNATP